MQKYARMTGPATAETFDGGQDVITGTGANAVRRPRNIVNLWSEAELAAIGLLPRDAAVIPAGHTVDSRTYAEAAGRIVEDAVTTPPPPLTAEQALAARMAKLDPARALLAVARANATALHADDLDALQATAEQAGQARRVRAWFR